MTSKARLAIKQIRNAARNLAEVEMGLATKEDRALARDVSNLLFTLTNQLSLGSSYTPRLEYLFTTVLESTRAGAVIPGLRRTD